MSTTKIPIRILPIEISVSVKISVALQYEKGTTYLIFSIAGTILLIISATKNKKTIPNPILIPFFFEKDETAKQIVPTSRSNNNWVTVRIPK